VDHLYLHIEGETRGEPVGIDFDGVITLRLEEYLMPLSTSKAYDLIFDGRTIARSATLDDTGKER
jgi:hypothetical protein